MPFLLTTVPGAAYVVAALQAGAHEPPPPPPPPALVVTLTELLCADIPNESLAATLKLNVVDAAKPETVKVVAGVEAIETPVWKDVVLGVAKLAGVVADRKFRGRGTGRQTECRARRGGGGSRQTAGRAGARETGTAATPAGTRSQV